jgi:Leucine-rich repeat (LRR) protein
LDLSHNRLFEIKELFQFPNLLYLSLARNELTSIVPFEKRATFNSPLGICLGPSRVLYVADSLNNKIRKITPTFSTATDIRPVAMQSLRVTHSPGVAFTLGPTLSAPEPPPNTIIYGHKRGTYYR